jgi:hypothetical protein
MKFVFLIEILTNQGGWIVRETPVTDAHVTVRLSEVILRLSARGK